MPWRNGGGSTLELLRSPRTGERFDWRLSVADVATDGPFSAFPGCDRILLVLAGPGLELSRGDGSTTRLDRPFARVDFAGEEPIEARLLDGPIRDFNVVCERARARADVAVVRAGTPGVLDARGATVLVFALHSDAELAGTRVPAGHLLEVADAAGPLVATTRGAALAVLVWAVAP
jgi:environmental stress-induced protein Ves